MEFCPKCGSVLVIKKQKSKSILACRKCNFTRKNYKHMEIKERLHKNPLDDVVIIDKSEQVLPTTKMPCPKCNHSEAFWWVRQMRSGDEAPTTFYRCTKCDHRWREY